MTEAEWLACGDPDPMLKFLGDNPGSISGHEPLLSDDLSRKLRLFACACCRRIWPLLATRRSRRAVEVAERFADKEAGSLALVSACLATIFHPPQSPDHIPGYGASLVVFTRAIPPGHAAGCAWHCARAIGLTDPGCSNTARAEAVAQAALVRDIFGDPFAPVPAEPGWLTPTVTSLAAAAYANRLLPAGTFDTPRLTALADAVEESGCADDAILSHLRSPGPHVRGCWTLDLILGKE